MMRDALRGMSGLLVKNTHYNLQLIGCYREGKRKLASLRIWASLMKTQHVTCAAVKLLLVEKWSERVAKRGTSGAVCRVKRTERE